MTIKFSITMQGSYPIRDYIEIAQRLETYGFDEVHVYDDLMFKPHGPAIITPQTVHPCYHAGNLAELD